MDKFIQLILAVWSSILEIFSFGDSAKIKSLKRYVKNDITFGNIMKSSIDEGLKGKASSLRNALLEERYATGLLLEEERLTGLENSITEAKPSSNIEISEKTQNTQVQAMSVDEIIASISSDEIDVLLASANGLPKLFKSKSGKAILTLAIFIAIAAIILRIDTPFTRKCLAFVVNEASKGHRFKILDVFWKALCKMLSALAGHKVMAKVMNMSVSSQADVEMENKISKLRQSLGLSAAA